MKNLFSLFFILLFSSVLPAQDETAITVTNSNLGLVKEVRTLKIQKGIHLMNLQDIPSQIQPTSVLIESKGHRFSVLEQNYEYDLINVDKVLNKSLNQEILVSNPKEKLLKGKLLAASSDNLMLLNGDGNLQIVPRNDQQKIILEDYSKRAGDFIVRPTLVWKIKGEKNTRDQAQISYLTGGLNWNADYVGKLNEEDNKIVLAGWVTIRNNSGKSFKKARLKLMAGDIHRVRENIQPSYMLTAKAMRKSESMFQEKSFFEYHLYSLQQPTDVLNNQVKQIQLFQEVKTTVKKTYRVDSQAGQGVNVIVSFKNTKQNNLGFALPAGKIRLYKADGKDVEFVGEDRINHTPQDETIDIRVGKAFDVVAERQVLKTERPRKRTMQQTVEFSLRNHKKKKIVVQVFERLNRYQQTKLLSANYKVAEKRADYFRFDVPLEANAEKKLTIEYVTKW